MNASPDPLDALTRLTSRFLDGELRDGEMKSLASLIESTPDGREHFVLLCELHAMLESEPRIRDGLGADAVPANVVPLPGSRGLSSYHPANTSMTEMTGGGATEGGKKSSRAVAVWLAAGSLGAAALILAGVFGPVGPGPEGDEPRDSMTIAANDGGKNDEATGREKPASVDEEPEKQYKRAVLATLGSGSQKRPPTHFKVEPSATDEEISFNRHIRPILSDNCYSCHGPDEAGRKADLRLDTLEGATGGESPAVIPGKPSDSELIARILTTEPDDLMPPADSHKALNAKQIDLLTRWVEQGARWEDHWSFIPVIPTLPEDIGGHPIDYFVDRELAGHQLTRSDEADRITLIRRATLDLTGLPPTPAEVTAFVENPDKDAYSRLIDDLLARPAFGEHRARYWLDAARYADTHGLHLDNYREIWPYRDWVIGAFNRNLPFDQFTIEQLAGDLLPSPTQDQRIATGFNRCNVTTAEGGSIEEEFLVRYAVDRVATTATVWMGLTAGCAQCHDHKFDPISMKDFYSLFAYFNNTTQPGMDGNAKDSPPVLRVYDSPAQEQTAKDLRTRIAAAEKRAKEALAAIDLSGATVTAVAPDHVNHGKGERPTDLGTAGNFGKSDPFTVAFRFALPEVEGSTVLARRTDPAKKGRGWSVTWENQGISIELTESHPNKSLKTGITRRFKAGSSGHFTFTYDGSGSSAGIRLYTNGEYQASRFVNHWHDSLTDDFKADGASLLVGGKDPKSGLVPSVTEFLVIDRRLTDEEIKGIATFAAAVSHEKKPDEKRSEKEKDELRRYLATRTPGAYREALVELSRLQTELSRIDATTPTTLVMAEKPEAPKARLLLRGEYEQKGDEVSPAVPAFLNKFEAELPGNRLGLAQWLVHPQHPLTARVAANRIWQELFGIGLVKTSDDFGTQGENPSHPELLDYLADTFVKSGWDVKALYRNIMLSGTYRQSSHIPEGMAKRDPENRLLARGPRFRLDAEVIRDQALAASGLIDPVVGGPAVKPYQPSGIWEAVGYTNSNTQTFLQDYGPSAEHRRSVYTFWKRTAHSPNLAILDAPNRESCVMRRERTNTPLQALVLMNDPQYVRASRYLALRVLGEASDRDERLDRMAKLLRGRPLTEQERLVVVNSLDQFRNIYDSDPRAAADLLVDEVNETFTVRPSAETPAAEIAAWTMVANQLQNLDEVLNKN
jgi:mono/diheme cytochrome c family protein